MDHMLEKPEYPFGTQGGENPTVGSISRKDLYAAWLAGAIDGEGCIHAKWGVQSNPIRGATSSDKRLRVTVTIANTHYLFIRKVTECLVELGVSFNVPSSARRARPGKNSRSMVQLVVEGKGRMLKLLPAVIPHLSCKRRQAELALELIQYRESLALSGRESKGRFGNLNLRDDTRINWFIDEIKREKWETPDILSFSRKPNTVFGESSET